MEKRISWISVLYRIGVFALILGAIDPLEGSVIIAAGSILVAWTTYKTRDRQWKIFLFTTIMMVVGIIFMFYFSSLGGFGGKSTLSWWWSGLILPYPIGWLTAIVLLIIRAVKK